MSTKSEVLSLLKKCKGKPLSGNEIAKQLSISRTAVWKAVSSLTKDGYNISAVNKIGYSLNDGGDFLDADETKELLSLENPEIIVYKTVSSTNDVAKELASKGAAHYTVVLAEQQTAGKGRLGRGFSSPTASGLYMSAILKADLPIEKSMLLTSAAGIAVCRAIKKLCGLDCQIKWVNDVYCNGKKLCGILTEASINFETRQADYIVVGIGINVNGHFEGELEGIAAYISDFTAVTFNRNQLAAAVLNELDDLLPSLGAAEFIAEYKSLSFILGSKINVITLSSQRAATAVDITENGYLVVEYENGEREEISSGEVSIRKI